MVLQEIVTHHEIIFSENVLIKHVACVAIMRTTFCSFFKCLNVLHDQCGYYFKYIFIGAIVNITVTTFIIYIHMANGNA